MTLYALVASDCGFAIELYPSCQLAEEALSEVLADEPSFVDLLSVVPVAPEIDDSRLN